MDLSKHDLLILIVECVIFCAIFIIGVFLQVKVIAVVKRDQAIAWEIHFVHSVVMIFHFSLVAIVDAVNYTQITFINYSLFHYPIFRYVVLFIKCFGISEMGFIHCTFQYTNISLFYNVKLLSVLEIKDQKNFYFGHILLVFSLGHYHT